MSEPLWRSIKCCDVQWHAVPGVSGRIAWALRRQCSPPSHYSPNDEHWHELTLGQLADCGERWWRRNMPQCGEVTIEAIKLAIDHAAAGLDLTRSADSYTPRPVIHSTALISEQGEPKGDQ